jgi:plastocyanin
MIDREQERREIRERAIFPALIPIAAIVLVEILVFSYSRVLLATGEMKAVALALGAALVILIGAAAIANADRIRTPSLLGLLTVGVLAVVVAGVVAEQKGPFWGNEPALSAVPGVQVSAKNVAFSTTTIKLPANNAVIDFKNEDTAPHNIAIFPNKNSLTKALFRGDITSPGTSSVYKVGSLPPGSYYFHCDVHPTQMFGTVTVS